MTQHSRTAHGGVYGPHDDTTDCAGTRCESCGCCLHCDRCICDCRDDTCGCSNLHP